MNGWLVFIGLVAAYMLLLYWLAISGRMQRWNLGLMLGFVLMIRTQRGKRLIDLVARPKRLWNAFADLGTVVTLALMALGFVFLVYSAFFVSQRGSGAPALGPREILVIPGVNRIVPLWYGITALVVTLVVHEGGHGVLARANNLRVKSLGLLYAVVPIGAFVEPDEEDLKAASRRRRLRVFSAGPATNLLTAALFLAAFASLFASATLKPGAHLTNVAEGSPAEQAGIEGLETIVAIDGQAIQSPTQFSDVMGRYHPGDRVRVGLANGEVHEVTLGSRWSLLSPEDQETVRRNDPAAADRYAQEPRLGVIVFQDAAYRALEHPFTTALGLPLAFQLPLLEFMADSPVLSVHFPTFYEAPWAGQAFWILVSLVFWLFWMNLAVGVTNVLPMLPLDGGHIFMDALRGVVAGVAPRASEERRERIVQRGTLLVTFVALGAFLATIVMPHVLKWTA